MTNTFDNKVYDFIKAEEQTERLSFDDIYPVGSIVRCRYNSPPQKGTWEMIGIHGTYAYDDSAHHWMTFNGKIADDYMRIDPSTSPMTTIIYTGILGNNYRILTPHNLMLNNEAMNVFSGSVTSDTGRYVQLTYYLESAHDMSISKSAEFNTGAACSIRIQLGPLTDVSSTVLNDENILVEYKRTD